MPQSRTNALRWEIRIGIFVALVCISAPWALKLQSHFDLHWLPLSLDPLKSWDYGALIWTATFCVYYYIYFTQQKQNERPIPHAVVVIALTPLFCILGVVLLLKEHWVWHAFVVLLVAALLLLTDWILYADYNKSVRTENHANRAKRNVLLADLPVVVSLLVLLVSAGGCYLSGELERDVGEFLGGVFAFQLLTSNVIFVLIESELFERLSSQAGLGQLLRDLWGLVGASGAG